VGERKGLWWLYVGAVLLCATPIWLFRYVPTQDGPGHLSSAFVFKELILGNPVFGKYYALNWTLAPYWAYHVVMTPLLFAFRPLVAEKVFLTLYVAAFAAAGWRLTRLAAGRPSPFGLLFLVIATSFPFHMGFFNSMAAVVAALFVVVLFWSRRETLTWRTWLALNAAVVACYFFHLLGAFTALAAVFVLALWSFAWRRYVKKEGASAARLFLTPARLAPSYVLPLFYVLTAPRPAAPARLPFTKLVTDFVSASWLVSFGKWQSVVAWATTAFIAAAVLTALGSRLRERPRAFRESDAFAALAVVFTAFYFLAPDTAPVGAYYLSSRFALFPFLFITPWLAANVPRRPGRLLGFVAAGVLLAHVGTLAFYYARENKTLRVFNSGLCVVTPGAVVLPLVKTPAAGERVEPLRHAVGYYVIGAKAASLVDVGAATGYFPVKWKPSVAAPPLTGKFNGVRVYDARAARPAPDYLITYDINPFLPALQPILACYEAVHARGRLVIYKRVHALPPASPAATVSASTSRSAAIGIRTARAASRRTPTSPAKRSGTFSARINVNDRG